MFNKIPQPHDAFFKQGLSHPGVSTDFLKAHLKDKAIQMIDWKVSPSMANTNFVDVELRQFYSDLVFQCKLRDKRDAYVYLLVEHQTAPDKLMSFRVLLYICLLMNEHLKKGNDKLPVVLNLLLYSGKKSPYPYSLDLYDCFEDPDLAREWMFKPLDIIDLSTLSEEILSQHGQADMLEILLKYGQEPSIIAQLKQNPALLKKLMERVYGKSGVSYILGVEKTKNASEVLEEIKKLVPDKKDDIMSAANQLVEQGVQQGKKEGIFTVAKNMLHNLHMGIDVVQQATGLSRQELAVLAR